MIARTLCFASVGKLSQTNDQLIWEGADGKEASVPIEDIGMVIVESERIAISSSLIRALAEHNVALVICDKAHTPSAQLLPYAANTTTAETAEAQLKATEAVQGRLWRKICRSKIANQAALIRRLGGENSGLLLKLAEEVKNGDPANCEAQAAKAYFRAIAPEGFRREREGEWPNAALNYGYAILRAAVARALVGSGLVCFRGIHHHNRYNAFALADDMMEPYRPFVDQFVFCKVRPFDIPSKSLEKEHRARLLEMLTCDVRLGDVRRPLEVAISYSTASLARYYKGEDAELALPEFL